MDSFSNLGHECSLCHGPAGAFDSVDLVTIKSDFVRRLETINGLTVYICKDCMDRYKENKLAYFRHFLFRLDKMPSSLKKVS